MKFCSFLALAIAPTMAGAFVVQPNKLSGTKLNSYTYGNLEGQKEPNGSGVKTMSPEQQKMAAAPKVTDRGYTSTLGTASGARNSALLVSKSPAEMAPKVIVQGGSLRTYSFATPAIDRAQLMLKTEGRPLNANIELWHGPDNTPQKMAIYSEDGNLRPVSIVLETPRSNNAIAIYNTGHLEFPLDAWVEPEEEQSGKLAAVTKDLANLGTPRTIQGGALHTYPFNPSVSSVQLMLQTDGRPLNARIELMQGPNNNKQVMEIYTEDGKERPFFCVIETPGTGNVVRVVNTATVEFPMYASVEPFSVDPDRADAGGRGWDNGNGRGWDNGGNSSFDRRLW